MNWRKQIAGCWGMVAVCVLLTSHQSVAEVKLGRDGLLRNVHGYELNGTALVPVRGFCEWLGTTVSYANGIITVAQKGTRMRLRIGDRIATVNNEVVNIGTPVMEFSGIACVSIRFLAEKFGARLRYVTYKEDAKWACAPHLVIEYQGREAVIIVHQAPPDVVSKFISDMENSTQQVYDEAEDFTCEFGLYGIDWLIRVTGLEYHGEYFVSDFGDWHDEINAKEWYGEAAGFYGTAYGVFGKRNGKWRLLTGGNSGVLDRRVLTKAGIPAQAAREMEFDIREEGEEIFISLPPPPALEEPPLVTNLTPANTRGWVRIVDNYAVRSVTFKPYLLTWAKVLGELATPVFKSTTKPIHVELSLIAYDSYDNLLGFSSIKLRDIPSEGAQVPFEVTMSDVRVSDIAYVRITPKGAWTYGK